MSNPWSEPVSPATLADIKSIINAIPKPMLTELRLTPADYVKFKAAIPTKPYDRNVIPSNAAHALLGIPVYIDADAPPLEEQLAQLKKEQES